MRIRGDGLSDIGRLDLPESFFEGTRRSGARGLDEQEMFKHSGVTIGGKHYIVKYINVSSSAAPRK
jgi:hypothetical protein